MSEDVDVAERLADLRRQQAVVMRDAGTAARAMHRRGTPIVEIARALGLSRPTIYAMLRRP